MKNREMLAYHNGLAELKKKEAGYFQRTGKQLFGGRIKLTYAIGKNMKNFSDELKPYSEAFDELNREYRDMEAEQRDFEEQMILLREAAEKSGGKMSAEPMRKVIYMEGKDPDEYNRKLEELLDIDAGDVPVYMVNMELLDGLDLSSGDVGAMMFMLAE